MHERRVGVRYPRAFLVRHFHVVSSRFARMREELTRRTVEHAKRESCSCGVRGANAATSTNLGRTVYCVLARMDVRSASRWTCDSGSPVKLVRFGGGLYCGKLRPSHRARAPSHHVTEKYTDAIIPMPVEKQSTIANAEFRIPLSSVSRQSHTHRRTAIKINGNAPNHSTPSTRLHPSCTLCSVAAQCRLRLLARATAQRDVLRCAHDLRGARPPAPPPISLWAVQ